MSNDYYIFTIITMGYTNGLCVIAIKLRCLNRKKFVKNLKENFRAHSAKVNYDEAFKWLNRYPLFFLRDASAVYTLAEMYFHGRGVEQDYSRALELYRFAYINGRNPNIAFHIGEMYEYGYEVEIDNQTAINYYTGAAREGNVVAMNKLFLIYETGEIVEQDYDKAAHWYFFGF